MGTDIRGNSDELEREDKRTGCHEILCARRHLCDSCTHQNMTRANRALDNRPSGLRCSSTTGLVFGPATSCSSRYTNDGKQAVNPSSHLPAAQSPHDPTEQLRRTSTRSLTNLLETKRHFEIVRVVIFHDARNPLGTYKKQAASAFDSRAHIRQGAARNDEKTYQNRATFSA